MGRHVVRIAETALALCLAGCAGRPDRQPTADTVLLVSDRGGALRIYELSLEDGAARLVGAPEAADGAYRDSMPARLLDGRIAFVSDRDGTPRIYLASADGSAATPLTQDAPGARAADSCPTPLGRDRIVFARREPGTPEGQARDLYVIRLDGTGLRRITRHAADDFAPAASPDGRAVAFISDRTGKPRLSLIEDIDAADPEVGVVDLSGAGEGSAQPPGELAFVDGSPLFLADGSIVFSRASSGGNPHLFHIGPAGAHDRLRQITHSRTLPFGADEPVLLPDRAILFVTGPVPPPEGRDTPTLHVVYRIEPGGFNLSRVSRERAPYSDYSRGLSILR
jgi:Tol biopolymer transport system component